MLQVVPSGSSSAVQIFKQKCVQLHFLRLRVQRRYEFVDLFTMHQATHLVDRMAVWVAECDDDAVGISDARAFSTFA